MESTEQKESVQDGEENNLISVWEDHVKIKDLGISMALCIGFALGGYLLAFGDIPPLISGLGGGVIGFIISSIIIKPKRTITKMKEGDEWWIRLLLFK